MTNPNAEQMRQTREALQAMAENLRTMKKQKASELSSDDVDKINQAITDTLDNASSLTASAIQDTVENIQQCVSKISDAKNSLDKALNNMTKAKNVLNIATSVVNLASAAMTGNVPSIVTATAKVVEAAAAA